MSNFPLTSPRDKSHSINGEMTEEQPAPLPEVIPCPEDNQVCAYCDDLINPCWGQVEPYTDLDDLTKIKHRCQGHKRVGLGGVYRKPGEK